MYTDEQSFSISYDEDGNVVFRLVLEKQDNSDPLQQDISLIRKHLQSHCEKQPKKEIQQSKKTIHKKELLHSFFEESKQQYQESASFIQKTNKSFQTSIAALWSFLMQPVWVLGKKKKPKQYSRLSLFFYDSLHFGTTFAVLFIGLFSILNYESYGQILTAQLNPLQQKHNELQSSLVNVVNARKMPEFSKKGIGQGSLLAFLPKVGPPEKRIVIPKLGLNVPIADVALDSLLDENWDQLEEDIQVSLRDGVVHYPGTARPGQTGNFFITGHSSYYPWDEGDFKTVFARLSELEIGDEYYVYYNGDKFRYIIDEKKEVLPTDVSVLNQPTKKRMGTLMTCTPLGTTLRRLILTATEVDPETGIPMKPGTRLKSHYTNLPQSPTALPI